MMENEMIHAALVAAGSMGLLYLWQFPLAQQVGYTIPLFLFLTAGVFVWDRIIHGMILR